MSLLCFIYLLFIWCLSIYILSIIFICVYSLIFPVPIFSLFFSVSSGHFFHFSYLYFTCKLYLIYLLASLSIYLYDLLSFYFYLTYIYVSLYFLDYSYFYFYFIFLCYPSYFIFSNFSYLHVTCKDICICHMMKNTNPFISVHHLRIVCYSHFDAIYAFVVFSCFHFPFLSVSLFLFFLQCTHSYIHSIRHSCIHNHTHIYC